MSTPPSAAFPVERLRAEFPALQRAGKDVFFDNAAGAQVPKAVFDAIHEHLLVRNVQRGGRYSQSVAVDEILAQARASIGALVNARQPNEIAFGMNATSFIRLVSLGVAQTLGERNEIIVTDLDHEANVATWLALEPLGARIRWWRMREDANLYLEDLAPLLSPKTRLLVCSGYKIFGPHMGFLWGRYELLQRLPTFREDFIPDAPPGKIEAGTVSYESVAGMDAAVRYLAQLGRSMASGPADMRVDVAHAMHAILGYERDLALELLKVLRDCKARVYGVADPARIANRVPTVSFTLDGVAPSAVTDAMARAGIGIRDGHLYCPRLMKRLGLTLESGAVRVSLVHYNTLAEIHRFGN